MSNRLWEMFDSDSEYNNKIREHLKQIKLELIANKDCSYCANSHRVPHIEMGKDGGTDTYCDVFNELKLGYGEGQQCIFWKFREDINEWKISSYMSLNNSEFEFTISDYNNPIVELFEKYDTDLKPKPNPVYVPKYISHKKKGEKWR